MAVYYNEWDENAAAWIRALIDAGELPAGHVDTRSIRDVRPDDLVGYHQWHFFAGIGGWPLAIRMAGLEGLAGIATGSPPCQPFSVAGKGLGQDDERHLAPVWLDLILSIRPQFIAGEQVWAAVRQRWLDDLFDRAEDAGYACGAACLPAAGVGAPHQRDRLFFSMADTSREFDNRVWDVWKKRRSQHSDMCGNGRMADADNTRLEIRSRNAECSHEQHSEPGMLAGGMGNADSERREIDALLREEAPRWQQGQDPETSWAGDPDRLADTDCWECDRITGREGCIADRAPSERDNGDCLSQSGSTSIRSNPFLRQWNDPDWLFCRDGKWRPVEPKSFPLADGVSKIMGPCGDPSSYLDRNPQAWRAQRLKGYGNAIVPQIGAAFLTNCMQALSEVGGCA